MMSCLGQHARAIRACVDNAGWRMRSRSVGAARGVCRRLLLPIAMKRVFRNRFQDGQPLRIFVDRVDLRKSFVNVRHCCDERRAFHERAGSRLPVERISPAVILVTAAASLLENLEKMDGALMICTPAVHLREKRETHGVVRVGNWQPLALPKEPARGRKKSFTKHHRSYGQRAEQRLAVVERFCGAAQLACVETLVIPGSLAVTIEPVREAGYGRSHFCNLCF